MNPRGHMQPYMNNSLAIRQEIQRFESVHPSIYAIYDLIEAIPDPLIQQQIREHVVCIEDSFVNSQEWTLSRSVPDLKLGILGSINSGKSALVHRYLTGSYMQEESPEGGRFKKEVAIDGQSYLLLIRDEGGPPEMQFTHWVDAVIFVFSLENEMSFNAIYSYYAKMAHYRNTSELPLILVGTQDAISESNPRVIDDARARKLANDLKRCSYYETCATYGLNVERVFQDACQKIIQLRATSITPNNSRPSTPNHSTMRNFYPGTSTGIKPPSYDSNSTSSQSTSGSGHLPTATPSNSSHNIQGHSPPFKDGKDHKGGDKKYKDGMDPSGKFFKDGTVTTSGRGAVPVACPLPPNIPPPPLESLPHGPQIPVDYTDYPSTPSASRRNKKNTVQKSNSFSVSFIDVIRGHWFLR